MKFIVKLRGTGEWSWRPVALLKDTVRRMSAFVQRQQLAQKTSDLAANKLKGFANKEYATALRDFSEAEKTKLDIALSNEIFESKVVKERAEARLAILKVLDAELELFKKLQEAGVVLRLDKDGNLTILPAPEDMNWNELQSGPSELKPKSAESSPRELPGG